MDTPHIQLTYLFFCITPFIYQHMFLVKHQSSLALQQELNESDTQRRNSSHHSTFCVVEPSAMVSNTPLLIKTLRIILIANKFISSPHDESYSHSLSQESPQHICSSQHDHAHPILYLSEMEPQQDRDRHRFACELRQL